MTSIWRESVLKGECLGERERERERESLEEKCLQEEILEERMS